MKQFNMNTTKIKDEDGNWSSLPSIKGESAYELAVRKGFEGSEDDYNDLTNKKFKQVNEDILKLSTKIYNSEIVENTSGEILSLDDHIENYGFRDCKLYGWSKQERTTGAQLFDASRFDGIEQYGVSLTVEDGAIYAEGTPTQNVWITAKLTADEIKKVFKNGKLTIKSEKVNNCNFTVGLYFEFISTSFAADGSSIELTLPENIADGCIYYYVNLIKDTEMIGGCKIMLYQYGDGTYEPYTGGQPSPSPDYPQQIVSAGNSGNIEVNVRGKNLVDVYGYSANGIPSPKAERILFNTYGTTLSTTEKTDKLIVHQEIIDGATANSYTSGYFCIGINRKLETGKDYIITFNINVIQNPFSVSTIFVLFNGIEANRAEVIGDKVTVKVSCKEDGERQYVEVRNCGMSLEISNFMITEKDENTIYEPYYEPQSLSISTPTGLPAIPVDTDGNYIDANGQQWIADYVDLKRGKLYKKVTRLNLKDVDAINIAHGFHSNGNGYLSFSVKNVSKEHRPISNRYKGSMWTRESGYTYVLNSNTIVFVDDRFTDKQTAIKLVQDTYVIYALTSQIETDLTPEEIQAYKNLVTYAGTTIVENDAECYMELGYVADPKAYIDKKFAELSTAIIASASEAE